MTEEEVFRVEVTLFSHLLGSLKEMRTENITTMFMFFVKLVRGISEKPPLIFLHLAIPRGHGVKESLDLGCNGGRGNTAINESQLKEML